MASIKTQLPQYLKPTAVKVYCEGTHEIRYLEELTKLGVIQEFKNGTPLQATDVKSRIQNIKNDILNDAIEKVIWIVDGGDIHIKNSSDFLKFYKDWLKEKDSGWKKLSILINQPCFEIWHLLHQASNTDFFQDADALIESSDFKKACPNFSKSSQTSKALAKNQVGRKRAIQHAKALVGVVQVTIKTNKKSKQTIFNIPRAEIYKLFDTECPACILTEPQKPKT